MFPFAPAVHVEWRVEKLVEERALKVAKKTYRENMRNMGARVVGLAIRYSGQPAFRAAITYAEEDRKWMLFPFSKERDVVVEEESESEKRDEWKRKRKSGRPRRVVSFWPA